MGFQSAVLPFPTRDNSTARDSRRKRILASTVPSSGSSERSGEPQLRSIIPNIAMTNTNGRIHVLIASDHPIFRDGLRQVLATEAGFELVGPGCDGQDALRTARKHKPDIVLLELAFSSETERQILQELASLPGVRTVLLGSLSEKRAVLDLLQAGARGVVSKESPVEVLVRCMRSVMAGQYWVGRDSVNGIVQALQVIAPSGKADGKSNNFGITSRELEIVSALAGGRTNKVIAKKLSLSEQTVKHHLTNIFEKLGVSGRLELAVFAANHGLLSQERHAGGSLT